MTQCAANQTAAGNHVSPLRVMYLTVGPAISQLYGAELSLLQLLDRLDPSRFRVCATIVQDEGAVAESLRARRLPVSLTGVRPFDRTQPLSLIPFTSSFCRVLALARQAKPDLIHVNHLLLNQYGALLARCLGLPSICHLRGRPTPRSYWGQLACLSTAIISNSHYTMIPWLGIGAALPKLCVIHNGVDVQDFHREVLRHRYARPNAHQGRVVVGVIGRIDPDKGHDIFLQAMARAIRVAPQVRALIAGDAAPHQREYERKIRSMVDTLGLSGHVRFVGAVADPRPFYAALDALVLPSRYEPFGRVVIEAMAAGLPVIATESGGPSEIVEPEKTGLLVPTGNPEHLAVAIQRLAGSADLCRDLGRAGLVRARRLFSLDKHIAAVQDLYTRLAEPRRAAAITGDRSVLQGEMR